MWTNHPLTGLVGMTQGVWLVGGTQKDAESLAKRLPELRAAHPVLIPQEPLMAEYNLEMNISDGSPSTGFAGDDGMTLALCTTAS